MRFLIVTAFLFVWLTAPALAQTKASVYFMNGMNNTIDEFTSGMNLTNTAMRAVAARINKDCPSAALKEGANLRGSGFYNPTGFGFSSDPTEGSLSSTVNDILEIAMSKLNEEAFRSKYGSLLESANPADVDRAAVGFAEEFFSKEPIQVQTTVSLVTESLVNTANRGERAVLVAHSQGGLIANMVSLHLRVRLPAEKRELIQFVHVGSAARPLPDALSLRWQNDPVTGPFSAVTLLGSVTPRNILSVCPGDCAPFQVGPGNSRLYRDDSVLDASHSFESYLSTSHRTDLNATPRELFDNLLKTAFQRSGICDAPSPPAADGGGSGGGGSASANGAGSGASGGDLVCAAAGITPPTPPWPAPSPCSGRSASFTPGIDHTEEQDYCSSFYYFNTFNLAKASYTWLYCRRDNEACRANAQRIAQGLSASGGQWGTCSGSPTVLAR